MNGALNKSVWADAARGGALPIATLMLVMLMIVPMPTLLLDMGFVANIMLSLVILMISLNSARALDFSAFPTVLLF
jgi:flagellar biosynthesis protein FlhA